MSTHVGASEEDIEPPMNQYLDIVANGFPICLAIIAEMIIITINISYLSDESAKAGLGLSGVLMHSFGGSFLFGFNYAFATFASRAFGAKNLPKFKLFVVQGLINLVGLLLILVVISLFSYRIMIFAGQEQVVSVYTSQFLIYLLPGFIAFYFGHFIKSVLQAQEIIRPIMLVDGISVIFHIIITHILSYFVEQINLVIITTNLTFILSLILTFVVQQKYSVWELEASYFAINDKFQDFKYFFSQCSYIALPVALDMFVFEFMMIFIGYFQNTPETTAHVIIGNIFVMIASVYYGFTSYMGTKIGNHVGRNEPYKVQEILWKVMKLVLLIIYTFYLVLYLFQDQIIRFYSDDPKVAYYIKPVINLYSIFFLIDGVQFCLSVYFKSMGYGSWVIKIFILCFYAIGISTMVLLTTVLEMKIMCAWVGMMMASLTLNCIYYKKWQEIDIVAITAQLNSKVNIDQLEHSLLTPLSDLKPSNP